MIALTFRGRIEPSYNRGLEQDTKMERKTRFELATPSLARRCSTTEPLPLTAPPGGVPDCCALIIIIANIRRAVAIAWAAQLWHGLGRPHPFGKLRTGLALPQREMEPLEDTAQDPGAVSHRVGRGYNECKRRTLRRDGRVDDGGGLENRYAGDCIVGSNPTPSATLPSHIVS